MYVVEIPLSEFLSRAVEAARAARYEAMLILLARTADGEPLQNEIVRDWESFEDLTHDKVLILIPRAQNRGKAALVRHAHRPEGVTTSGLSFGSRPSREWEAKFWYAPSASPHDGAALGRLGMPGGEHAPRRPDSGKDHKAAITASVGDTARFLGISEAWLPCLIVFALQERQLFCISIDNSFSLYAFIRNVMINYEPVLEKLASLEAAEASLRTSGRESQAVVNREDRKKAALLRAWDEQRGRVCDLLMSAGRASAPLAEPARLLVDWLNGATDLENDRVDELVATLLDGVKRGSVPEYAAGKLKERLPRAVKKRIEGPLWHEDLDPNVQAKAQATESARQQVDEINLELSGLRSELDRSRTPFSETVLAAAGQHGLDRAPGALRLPAVLAGWEAMLLSREPDHNNHSSEPSGFDVAISYARSDRPIARAIAKRLQSRGIEVFYDEFHKHVVWGKNLHDYLHDVYFNRSRFCVILVSKQYVEKVWTNFERQVVQARALLSTTEYILPVRLEAVALPATLPTVAYLDFEEEGLDGVVAAILHKCSSGEPS